MSAEVDRSYYEYNERLKAVEQNNTFENRKALWDWFNWYGNSYWNGEHYVIDDSRNLYPIYRIDTINGRDLLELADKLGNRDEVTLENIYDMDDIWEIVDCEIR